jgi:hypothetical protein
MADIDQIIAGGAGAGTTADFSGIGKLADAYYKGRDERAKNDLRDAFKDGVPLTADGQPDFGAMAKTLYQKGGIDQGNALISAAVGPTERAKLGGLDGPQDASPQPQSSIVSPPSSNRSASTVVAPPLNRGGAVPQGDGGQSPGGQQPTVMAVLAAQGIPNDQLGAASASIARQLGVDPTAPLNLQDPQVRNVLAPAIAQLKRQGIGQVQPPQPGDNPPQQIAQAAAPQVAPQDDQILKRLTLLAASPDKATAAAAQTRLKSYLAAKEPTPEMKNAAASGQTLPAYQESQGDMAATQAGAVERAKSYVEKYNTINEAGDKAISEIPKLHLALKQMDDPNYYSGPFNQYNLNAKRLVAALGGDPDKAAPQEIVGKITADSVLNGMGSLKGLGPIRVAEMKLLSQASMSPDNSIQAQKFLATMAIRVQERVAKVSDEAQNYNDGVLDNGFDKKIRAMDKREPLFTTAEIDRFQKIMQGKEKQTTPQGASAASSFANQKFESPEAARAAGAKAGDIVTDATGKQWKLK